MITFKQRFNLVEGYLSAILFLVGPATIGIDLVQKGDFKTTVALFIGGLIVSIFYFIATIRYQKRIRYYQIYANQDDGLKEGFAGLYAKLDELEKRG